MERTNSLENGSKKKLSVIMPAYNERNNISILIRNLLILIDNYELEILVVDDDSSDGTTSYIKELARQDYRIRLIHRVDRSGLSSAIKEGILDASGDFVAVMDSDGQHEPIALINAIQKLRQDKLDLVAGSRFLEGSNIKGLSKRRRESSSLANNCARFSLPSSYSHLTDYMSGCFVIDLKRCFPFIRQVDVNGFKFLYEFLAVTKGQLRVGEVPLNFRPRNYGVSKLDLSVLWDFLVSLLHTFSLRILPRRAISFALVGATGILVQLLVTHILMNNFQFDFPQALPFSVITAATSNYLINNALTFRAKRLQNWNLLRGLLKFLLVASLPVLANIGLSTTFYSAVINNAFWAQMAGIIVVFVWNYAASSRFVWNTP